MDRSSLTWLDFLQSWKLTVDDDESSSSRESVAEFSESEQRLASTRAFAFELFVLGMNKNAGLERQWEKKEEGEKGVKWFSTDSRKNNEVYHARDSVAVM